MKKKLLFSAAAALLLIAVSCSPSKEKMITGEWVLDSIKIENLDDYCAMISQINLSNIDAKISMLDNEIANQTDESEKQKRIAKKEQSLNDRAANLPENIKSAMIDQHKQLIGKMKAVYNENKTYTLSVGDFVEPQSGKWSVEGDSLVTVPAEKTPEKVLITNLSDSKMSFVSRAKKAIWLLLSKCIFQKNNYLSIEF